MAHSLGRRGEGDGVCDRGLSDRRRSPARVAARRAIDDRRHHAAMGSIVELEQHRSNHLAQLTGAQRREGRIDIDVGAQCR